MTRVNEIMEHLDSDVKVTLERLEEQITAAISHAASQNKEFIWDMHGIWSSICDIRTMVSDSRYEIEKEE